MNRSVAALVRRGIDTEAAAELIAAGWNAGKLAGATETELVALGLPASAISSFLKGGRPPIPIENAMRVLHRNRFQCCICRDPSKPIILHHINPWAKSRDHSDGNLAVLCLDHHERAHSVSSLARNLDPLTLRNSKREWEGLCAEADRDSIIQASRIHYDAWLYFNHLRLFELAREVGIAFTKVRGFAAARKQALVDEDGNVLPRNPRFSYMYDDVSGLTLYEYVRGVLEQTLERISLTNFSDLLDRGAAQQILASGDFAMIQGAHMFARRTGKTKGKGEVISGVRRANNVEFRFTFDRWEATSCSSWATWLTGRQAVASLVQVKDIVREDGNVVVACTVIAISNGHRSLQHRNYSPRYGHYIFHDEDGGDEDALGDWGA